MYIHVTSFYFLSFSYNNNYSIYYITVLIICVVIALCFPLCIIYNQVTTPLLTLYKQQPYYLGSSIRNTNLLGHSAMPHFASVYLSWNSWYPSRHPSNKGWYTDIRGLMKSVVEGPLQGTQKHPAYGQLLMLPACHACCVWACSTSINSSRKIVVSVDAPIVTITKYTRKI